MSAEIITDGQSVMLMTMNMLAEKYGCKLDIDFTNHTVQFDCPNKKVEADLALEIDKILEGSDQNN